MVRRSFNYLKEKPDEMARFVSIWFRHLSTDWFTIRQPQFLKKPLVLKRISRGRMLITAANAAAERQGIGAGMVLADARAIVPNLEVLDDKPELGEKLLNKLAEWCIRFTPVAAIDPPDGLLLDVTGCSHLWGGDQLYLEHIIKKINGRGYNVRAAIADTMGAAWAVARFGKGKIVKEGGQLDVLLPLPPEALRLEPETVERLHKLGLHQIHHLINISRKSLRGRFGQHFIMRLDMALGQEIETLIPIRPIEAYQERLPCLEPIVTATGIEIALKQLLEALCKRLQKEQNGLRSALFKCYRFDGKVEQISIGTNRPSCNAKHLFKLFELNLPTIEPALGIELFVLEASKVEEHYPQQGKMLHGSDSLGLEDTRLSELIDRLAIRLGTQAIHRYVPDEHYWPERSIKAASLDESLVTTWPENKIRPLLLLPYPDPIEVTAPIPDYPPMLFKHKGKLHRVIKADGPERIEQEWWLQQGQHRDYYSVEDEEGCRYWLFRLGHYDDKRYQWFLHGFFA